MKVLVACEWSGVVRDAFRARGHDAWSCDILPTAIPGPHWQCPVQQVHWNYDLLIAFPPCTDLAVSGARYFAEKRADGRQQKAIDFFLWLATANVERIAIENPVGIMSSVWRKPDQTIQPWQFGHDASKTTCLWLKNLPLLKRTDVIAPSRWVDGRPRWGNQTPSGQNKLGPSPTRAAERGKTYQGIADAMAEQWGSL